jgi:hypothetical protein
MLWEVCAKFASVIHGNLLRSFVTKKIILEIRKKHCYNSGRLGLTFDILIK